MTIPAVYPKPFISVIPSATTIWPTLIRKILFSEFNRHRILSQTVQIIAIGNLYQSPSVSQSHSPLINSYARPSSTSVCSVPTRTACQVHTHATPAFVQQSKHTSGPSSYQTQPVRNRSVIFASTHGSSTGTTIVLTQPNTVWKSSRNYYRVGRIPEP